MEVDRNGLEVLGREECLALLARTTLGRVGISHGALPSVLPVNYRLAGDQIVFRTGVGTKLDAAVDNAVVAFEIDDMDAMRHEGWSVLVVGVAHVVRDERELGALTSDRIPRWAPGPDGRVVAVPLERVSGRRLVAGLLPP